MPKRNHQLFTADAIIAHIRDGHWPGAGWESLNRFPQIDLLRARVEEKDIPRLFDIVEQNSDPSAALALSLLHHFCRREDVKLRLQARWDSADVSLQSHLLWRILDDPHLPQEWHARLFDFILSEWETFKNEQIQFMGNPQNVIPRALRRIDDPTFPETKKWAYLCCVPEIAEDQAAAKALVGLGHKFDDSFTRKVAAVLLKQLFPKANLILGPPTQILNIGPLDNYDSAISDDNHHMMHGEKTMSEKRNWQIVKDPAVESRLSDEERMRTFFYAEYEAGTYDGTIELVVPSYRLMQESMVDLLKYHFDTARAVDPKSIRGTILDIGSGTGEESIRIMKEFPNIKIVALDLCKPMHDEFQKRIENDVELDTSSTVDRVKFLVTDLLDSEPNWESRLLKHLPKEEQKTGGYKAVISAFTIHHLTDEQKKLAYVRMFDVLEPGGVMINGDLFDYASGSLASYAQNYDLDWIGKQFNQPSIEFEVGKKMPKEKRKILADAWLAHYRDDNKLSSIAEQIEMLRQARFVEIGNPFRFWQVGILWGRKAEGGENL